MRRSNKKEMQYTQLTNSKYCMRCTQTNTGKNYTTDTKNKTEKKCFLNEKHWENPEEKQSNNDSKKEKETNKKIGKKPSVTTLNICHWYINKYSMQATAYFSIPIFFSFQRFCVILVFVPLHSYSHFLFFFSFFFHS